MTFEEHLIKEKKLVGIDEKYVGRAWCESCGVYSPIFFTDGRYICRCGEYPFSTTWDTWEKGQGNIECLECDGELFSDITTQYRRSIRKDGTSVYCEVTVELASIIMCTFCGTTYKLEDNKLIPYGE